MSSIKVDIQWSPRHENKFVLIGTDLSLYKVEPIKDGRSHSGQVLKLSDTTQACLLASNSDHQYIKCVAWNPGSTPDHLIAVGQVNGRVVLTSFVRPGTSDPNNLIGKEFVPRHARHCNDLAWNPVDTKLLAVALDKYKADYSILIWDVNAKTSGDTPNPGDRKSYPHQDVTKPYAEIGPSETTLSLDWFPQEEKTLVAGMNHKFLRIYDLRDISRPQSVAYTKQVYGVSVDPHSAYRLASYVDGQVSIWDTRNFDKPVLTFQDSRHVVKLAWCPTRSSLLASLSKESSVVKLYDIQNGSLATDDLEPAIIERYVQPYGQHAVSSFAWHPTHENRMLTITPTGTLKDVTISERIAVDWSPDFHLLWSAGKNLVQCNTNMVSREASQDISIKMRRRAMKGYGIQFDKLWQNGQFAGDDIKLRKLWIWLDYMKNLIEDEKLKVSNKTSSRYVGVLSVIRSDGASNNSKSDLEFVNWQGIDGPRQRMPKKTYISEERCRILQLCGWGFDRDSGSLNVMLDRLENEGEYERAAAIALFNLKIRRAIQILNKGSNAHGTKPGNLNLNVVAMALSGFTDEKNTLWREICSTIRIQLTDPYLRALFAFLTTDSDNYDEVLNETSVAVIDRVAFAALYLPDAKLNEYIEKLTGQMIDAGNLDGILLTGLTTCGLDLLERYIDITSDVQTAAAIVVLAFPSVEISKDPRVQTWTESYRNLLDCWRLWHQRAEFDVHRNSFDTVPRPQPQVFVSCNFCGKPIAHSMLAPRLRNFVLTSASAHKSKESLHRAAATSIYSVLGGPAASLTKITSCPGCRKPLPRCSLCLVNMGTPAGSAKHRLPQITKGKDVNKLTQFDDWFTWCQTCRHGGHSSHMAEWFRDHPECPVTACSCKCTLLDTMWRSLEEEDSVGSPT